MNLLFILTVIGSLYLGANGARILAVFPFEGRSHYNVYEPVVKRLAEKGHEVVSVTHFPSKVPTPNLTDVKITLDLPKLNDADAFMRIMNAPWWARLQMMLHYCGVVICDPVFQHPEMQKIIQSKEKFDVFIVEIFSTECFLGIAHTLDIPIVVGMISSVAVPWSNDIMRNPEIPSYIPNYLSGLTDKMNFFQRIRNTWNLLYTKTFYRYFSDKPSYEIAKKYLGDDLPDFDWLRSKISLILANGHLTISPPRALAPGFKDVGGIHIPHSGPPPLPKDLKDHLDNQRKDSVIYFSLGSQLDATTMPEQVLAAFYRAFEQLPQQILWKCTEEKMPTLPRNVKCIEWAPQLSILCHPNVRMFITHGGLLGTQEAVYCGVPMLGIPLFGDQHSNVAYSVKKGLALELDYYGLSYEAISSALNEMLKNKSYGEMAQRASLQFRDRPIPPVEEGVYWIEYLIRHGPDSLKIEASNLTWYQYLLLDIVCVITAVILIVIWIIYKLVKLIFHSRRLRLLRSRKKFD